MLVLSLAGCRNPMEREMAFNDISLALSLGENSSFSSMQTKMTAAITQNDGSFRGIEQVYVVPFRTESAAAVTSSIPVLNGRNVAIQNSGIKSNGLVAGNNSHLYEIVSLPRRMNRVLVYGNSVSDGSLETVSGKHLNGVLVPHGLDNPASGEDISFSLEPVAGSSEAEAINIKADNLISALNSVVEAMQGSEDEDIRHFLDVFAQENRIFACSAQTLYRMEQNILGELSVYSGTSSADINLIMSKVTALQSARSSAGAAFPSSYGIPEGSIGMWWNGRRFVRLLDGVNIRLVPMEEYCYPPGLWYFANSPVQTSDDENVKVQYKPQNATWGDILSYYSAGVEVKSSTRSVAIVEQLQYGAGLLEVHFDAPGTEASVAAGCPVTGIIIGEQDDLDFSFAPKSSSSRFIYDNNVSGMTMGSTASGQSIRTLVNPTAAGQVVHFALEFMNNTSSTFQGRQGEILPGCKFYLAGELKPSGAIQPATEVLQGVFTGDHKTTVHVRVDGLDNAYNVVPDLRDPQLEIGVVADIDWIQITPGGIKLPY